MPLARTRMAAQTPEGEIWVAGSFGDLMRFDGDRWTVLSGPTWPLVGAAGFVLPDRDRGLLVLSQTGQGFHLARDGTVRMTMEKSLPATIASAARDTGGRLWLSTSKDLFYWQDSELKMWPNPGFGRIHRVVAGSADDIWVAAAGGLFRVMRQGARTERYLEGTPVRGVAKGAECVWAATGRGVFEIRGNQVNEPAWSREVNSHGEVQTLLEDRQHNLWLVLKSKIARVAGGKAEVLPLATVASLGPDVFLEENRWAFEDHEGQIWFGLGLDGVLQVADSPFQTQGAGEGLPGMVWNVLEDRAGRTWAGTAEGLYVSGGSGWRRLTFGLPDGNPTAMMESRSGAIWATYPDWLIRLEPDRVLERIPTGRRISSMIELGDGVVLGASRKGGLVRIQQGKAEALSLTGQMCAQPRVLLAGRAGETFVGCYDGLYVIENGKGRKIETGVNRLIVTSLYLDRRGTLWMGSARSGLCRIRDGRIHWFRTREAGRADDVHAVMEDRRGYLWLSSDSGLRRVARRELEDAAEGRGTPVYFQHFDIRAGLRDSEFQGGSQPAVWLAMDGAVWAPSRAGLVRINPDFRFRDQTPYVPVLSSLLLAGQPLPVDEDRVSFASTAGRLSIDFRIPIHSRPYTVSYRLTGFDEQWATGSPGAPVTYTNLPPGLYGLLVRAAPYGGEPGAPRKLLEIEVRPRFFQRNWFYVLGAMLLLACGGGMVWFRGEAVRRRNRQLETEVRRRTAELETSLRSEQKAMAAALARERDLELTRERLQREMEERRAVEQQLAHAQKMESIDRLAGGVAHDFNNLLTVIFANVEMARISGGMPEAHAGILDEIELASKRASDLTRQLLTFARRQMVEPRVVDLNTLTAETSKLMRRLVGEDVELTMVLSPEPVVVKVDPGQFEQVLINLVVNARDALSGGGKICVETAVRGGEAILTVADTGCGMTAETVARIFEPFFTTKQKTGGTGLGLAICYGIVRQAGGEIRVQSRPGEGARFDVHLPLASGQLPAPSRGDSCRGVGGDETVLVVEDEGRVRDLMAASLSVLGYRVLTAANGEDAVRVAAAAGSAIDLVVADVVMPLMGGAEMAERLAVQMPGARVLYISGYTGDSGFRIGAGQGFLSKPFTMSELAGRVRAMLDSTVSAG
ncbi:MAG: ATP-binding protein [Bryobacteraceae bacterium]|nr:ATP-binding protein [Bryobacteraceae bacterium]